MKKFCTNPFRHLSILSLILILVFVFMHLILKTPFQTSIIPYPLLFTEGVYILCCFFCIICAYKSKYFFLYYIGLEFLAIINILNGNYLISFIFMIYLFTLISIIENRSKKIFYFTILICLIVNSLLNLLIDFSHFARFFSLAVIYSLLYISVARLIQNIYSGKDIKKKSDLNIHDLNFTERQIFCVKEILLFNSDFKSIAKKYNISESVIKKEMQYIYKTFNVNSKSELLSVLNNYRVEF